MTNETQKTPKDARRTFADLLDELRDGDAQLDASEALAKLIAKVRETCKPGEIHLKLRFAPSGNGKLLGITDEIIVKNPKQEKTATYMFTDQDGRLSKDNPEQMRLPLKEVPAPDNVREIPKEAPAPHKIAYNN